MGRIAQEVPEVHVKSRHRADCKYRTQPDYITCSCPKQLMWSHNGKLYRVSAQTCDWQVAQDKAAKQKTNLERSAAGEPTQPLAVSTNGQKTISEVVALFIKTKESEGIKDKHTGKLQLWLANRFVNFCNARGLIYMSDVKPAHLNEWRNSWEGAATTRAKIQHYVKGFFKWCLAQEYIERKNPAVTLSKIEGGNDYEEVFSLTGEQFAQALELCSKVNGKTTEADRAKLHALLNLMRYTGLAIGDAVTLERSKLSTPEDGWYHFHVSRRKTGNPARCHIKKELADALFAVAPSGQYFFWDGETKLENVIAKYQYLIGKISDLAGFVNPETGKPMDFHSHMMRHTFVRNCLANGMTFEDVAYLIGDDPTTVKKHYWKWDFLQQKALQDRFKAAMGNAAAKGGE